MSNIAIIEKFYHAIATGQAEVIADLLDEKVELIVPGNDGVLHGHYHGKDCFLNKIFPTVFSCVNPEQITFCKNIKIVNADGENVTALAQNDGIALTGEAYNQLYGHIFRLRDGKIIRMIEFYDGLLAQAALWQNTPHVQADAGFNIENITGISQSNLALAQAFIAAWESNNSARILELMHDDCFYHNIPLPALEGKKAISDFVKPFLETVQEVEWDVHEIGENSNGCVFSERTDKFKINNYWVCVPVMGSMKFENGLLTIWRDYFDLATFETEIAKAQKNSA